jgi:hypothetical protein
MKKLLINLSVAGLIVSCAGLAQAETPNEDVKA